MKALITLSLAALVLAVVSASPFAVDAKKKTIQKQVATANQKTSIKHLLMRATILVVNQ